MCGSLFGEIFFNFSEISHARYRRNSTQLHESNHERACSAATNTRFLFQLGYAGVRWGIVGVSAGLAARISNRAHSTPNTSTEHTPTHACCFPGELAPTAGSAYLSGFDVNEDPEEVHRLVGFCPQFDALFETLTAREHLALYASIKVSNTTHMS